MRTDGGLDAPILSTDEMLLFTEWPLRVDTELSVSEEMVESGRGMNSTLSENPTRGREGGLAMGFSSASSNESASSFSGLTRDAVLSLEVDTIEWSSGVLGKLLLKRG